MNLNDFGEVLRRQAAEKAEAQKEFSTWLDTQPMVLWKPLPEAGAGHGIGWFRGTGGFAAYRKFSNGWDPMRIDSVDDELVRTLYKALPCSTSQ